jgi:hypothetical protein
MFRQIHEERFRRAKPVGSKAAALATPTPSSASGCQASDFATVFPTMQLRDEAVENYRDRGRPTDPEQPACQRHRDRCEGSGALTARKVLLSVSMSLDGFIAAPSPWRS